MRASSLDAALFDAALRSRSRPLDAVFVPASHSGTAGLPWMGLALAVRFGLARGRSLGAVRSCAAIGAGWAAGHAAKRLTKRTRPCEEREGVAIVECPESSSMPSDQASSAFAGAAVIAAAVPSLAAPLYAAAALTASSRVYVGVHYPSDVLVGALLGQLVGGVAARIGT